MAVGKYGFAHERLVQTTPTPLWVSTAGSPVPYTSYSNADLWLLDPHRTQGVIRSHTGVDVRCPR